MKIRSISSTRARLGAALTVAGLGLAAFTVGDWLRPASTDVTAPPASTSALQYTDHTACLHCPAGITLTGVEVQNRTTSTLFVLRGHWPKSADQLASGLHLVANDLDLTLDAPTATTGLTVASATKAGAAINPAAIAMAVAVAVAVQGDALLVDITNPNLHSPVTFHIGLWDGTAYLARLPKLGDLIWTGSGAPHQATSSSAPTPTTSSSQSTTGPDATAYTGACSSVPSGTVPAFLTINSVLALPVAADPRTGAPALRREEYRHASAATQSARKPPTPS